MDNTSADPIENSVPVEAFFGSESAGETASFSEDSKIIDLASPENAQSKDKTNDNNSDKTKDKEKPGDGLTGAQSASNPSDPGNDNGASNYNNNSKTRVSTPESDAATGALVYSYSIETPPGRNGIQPSLGLSYNSQNASNDNIMGYGWSVDISYIERINKKGTDKLYTENYFSSSISGELVFISGTQYSAKIENGDFLKYEFSNNTWTVTDKSGTKYKFGLNANSRQDNPNDSAKVYKWMLEEVRDLNDNYIRYEYFKDAGQIYPSRIIYTGNGATDGIFTVEFIRETRSDANTSYVSGFQVKTSYRINEIQAKANGIWVKKYALAYTTGDNTVRSTLYSITESGQDESSNVVTLPATSFEYRTGTDGWTRDYSWSLPVDTREGIIIADLNGDGFPDILQSYYSSNTGTLKRAFINNSNGGWVQNNNLTPIPFFHDEFGAVKDQGVRPIDVNGDGLMDLIQSMGNNGPRTIYINNGNGWMVQAGWVPLEFSDGKTGSDTGSRIADLNGDGLSDLVYGKRETSDPETYSSMIYLNSASGWSQDTNWTLPIDTKQGVVFVDINGDGLEDIMQSYSFYSSPTVYQRAFINDGNGGWSIDTNYTPPTLFYGENYGGRVDDLGVRVADVNGDGYNDLMQSLDYYGLHRVFMNSGSGWVEKPIWVSLDFSDGRNYLDTGTRIADLNGDGLSDLIYGKRETSSPETYSSMIYLNNTIGKIGIAKRIINVKGGLTDVAYKPSAQYKDAGNNLLNPNLPLNVDTVYQITNNDGLGNSFSKTYSYEGGKYYFDSANPFDRKFSGFSKVVETDGAGNKISTHFHQGDATNSAQGEYLDNYSKIGRSYRSEVSDSAGNIYSKTINKWESYDLGGGRNFVKLTQKIDSSFDGNASHRDKAETFSYDDINGNLTTKTQWGEVTGSDDGTFTDVGTDKLMTTISYASNASLNIFGLPSQNITTDQSANKVSESKYYYDTLALGSVNKGNQTKEEKWKSGTNYINTQKSYNSYGLVTSETDARDNATSYIYDSYNLYPESVTNPLNQITQYTHDYSLGKPKQVTDQNGYVFQTVYDGLDRVLEEKQPDLAVPATLVTKSSYIYTDTPNTISIKKTDYLDATNGIDSYSYFDGLGRVIQTRKEAESANMYSVSDLVYNNRGLLQKESLLYFSTGLARTSATTDNALYSTYVYDPLERMTSTTNAVGTITSAYDDWKVTTTDAKGTLKTLYKDAYGNLIRVDEHNGANVYATNYSYDKLGNLLNITDALGNVRNFTYDAFGGRLSAEDLHAPADPTFGTYGYSYDANGNLISKTDPKGQVVNYVYDALNRQTSEDYTGQTGMEVTYVYDTCIGGKGRLCSVINSASSETKEYDPLGLIKTETKTIDSTNYRTEYEYDRQGNETILTNPDSSQTKYEYNSAGLLEKVSTKESGSSGLPSNTDLVGFWNFNEGTGISAGDSSGSGHNGTLENMESSDWVQGVNGTALNFDGINERIDMGIMENVPAGQGITVSVWINPAELTSGGHVISRYSPSGIQYSMWKGSNDVAFFINGGSGGNYVVAYDVLSTSTWTHLVGVFNDATKEHKLYANGVLIQSRIYNVTLNNPAVKTLVGTSNYYQDYFNGKIDEARVYNKVLTDAEILALYQKPSGSVSSNFTDLVTNYDYSPLGKVTTQTYANGVSTTNTYDAMKLYRLSSKVTTIAGGGHGQDLAYAYDANGNITRIVDNSATNSKKTTDYIYDSLNRLLSATATGVTQSDVGIAGYWNFNESSGQVASDSSGNGNSGTLSGGMTNANWVSGISGNALDLDGGDDEIIVSDSLSLSPSLPITMSAWVNPDSLSGNRGIIGKWNTSWETMAYAMMILPNGALRGFFADGTNLAGKDSVGGVISTGSWYHIAAVVRGLNDVSLYVNGQEVSGTYGGNATSTYDNTAPMRMGAIVPGSGNNIDGKLDEVRIYNRTLSSQEILDLYNSPGASGSQNYTETYVYDAIGNITNKSDQGNYAYSQTGKANPHAVTSMGSANYAYDDNGNLLTASGGLTNTWDYSNRITQSVVGATTVTYGYDASGQRVKYATGSSTTVYPSRYYNTDGTPTKHVFAGGQLVATIKGTGASAQVYSVSTDHLTGSNIVTNSSGTVEESMDYYPYGDIRLDEKASSFNEQRKYAGHEYDTDTGLSYMNARYYNGRIGKFVSQDPAFLNLSQLKIQLVDPQSWNSYAYARNNPLVNIDESGQFWDTVIDAATTYYDTVRYGERMMVAAAGAVNIGIGTAMNNQRLINAGDAQLSQGVQGMDNLRSDIAMDAAGTAIPGVPILGLKAVKNVDEVANISKPIIGKMDDIGKTFVGQTKKIHGNSLDSPKNTFLYELFDNKGSHLKYGITSKEDPLKRYTNKFMEDKSMKVLGSGSRREMYQKEASIIKNNPRGPLQKNNH
ncbi:MAG: LamG-like jellyroll fold domain-containing protein [Candidatus Paceibacterota bacterium]